MKTIDLCCSSQFRLIILLLLIVQLARCIRNLGFFVFLFLFFSNFGSSVWIFIKRGAFHRKKKKRFVRLLRNFIILKQVLAILLLIRCFRDPNERLN